MQKYDIAVIGQHGSYGLENEDEGSCSGTTGSKCKLVRKCMG